MIADELSDFEAYWRKAFWDEEGEARGIGEVDYRELKAWAKGNSFSVDQSTITMGRRLMTLLGDRLKDCLIKSDEGLRAERHWGKEAGATLTDLEREAAFNVRKGHKYGGQVNKRWYRIESILQEMFLHENIELYQSEDTLIGRLEKTDFVGRFSETTLVESEKSLFIVDFLDRNKDAGGHIRLSHVSKRWDIYIRDRYGAPPGIVGVLPGDLEVGLQLGPKYLQMDLHLAYGETISRKVSQFSGKERGKGHYAARAKICDLAANNDGVVSLDAYYRLFARASAEHMADYYLTRSVGDSSAAEFGIREILDSDPKRWEVVVDTGLIRWRELSRERGRERGEEEGDGVGPSTQGGA